MLLTKKQALRGISNISKTCDKRLTKRLNLTTAAILSHYERDYTNCAVVKEIGSPYFASWVVFDIFEDLTNIGENHPYDCFEATLMIELEDGSTYSAEEAIEGLGSIHPDEIKKEAEKIADDNLRNFTPTQVFTSGSKAASRPPSRTVRTSENGWIRPLSRTPRTTGK